MNELRLVGLHDDGEHVLLEGPDGQRFRLPIDEALRAAVRRDRPALEQVRAELTGALPPREIQARIRAGHSAAEVAEASGMPVEMVRRYEGPVVAEREFVAAQAGAARIGRDPGAPVLGELVTDRLATRGVDQASVRWDAYRTGTEPWTVEVGFDVGGSRRSARWSYVPATRAVRALDDEARWLSETELADEPIPRRHLSAVRAGEPDVEAAVRPVLASVDAAATPEPEPEPDPQEQTQALLDDLTGRRGVRQEVVRPDEDEDDDGEEFEGFGPQHAFDFDHPELTLPPAAHPPASRPDQATDARVLPILGDRRRGPEGEDPGADAPEADGPGEGDGPGDAPDEAPAQGADASRAPSAPAAGTGAASDEPVPPPLSRGRSRRGRASVPSWDEIVFGAKPE